MSIPTKEAGSVTRIGTVIVQKSCFAASLFCLVVRV